MDENKKRLTERDSRERKVWYQCDPARNPKCPKTTCKYNPDAVCLPEVRRCDRTSNPEAARRDEKEQTRWVSSALVTPTISNT